MNTLFAFDDQTLDGYRITLLVVLCAAAFLAVVVVACFIVALADRVPVNRKNSPY